MMNRQVGDAELYEVLSTRRSRHRMRMRYGYEGRNAGMEIPVMAYACHVRVI